MRFVALLRMVVALVLFGFAALALYSHGRRHPEDLPWTRLTLDQPIGIFTGRKLTALTGEPGLCRTLLDRAGVRYTRLPAISAEDGRCGYADGVRLRSGGAMTVAMAPAHIGMACPVAAALAIWEWRVVQPAALRHFGRQVVRIDTFGSYSCRRMYGRSEGSWSEHATADAIDIAGFRLADGARITVARDWKGDDAAAAFLREVRDGACDLYATVLSPDYNAAHADHLHLDQAERGATGWRACR